MEEAHIKENKARFWQATKVRTPFIQPLFLENLPILQWVSSNLKATGRITILETCDKETPGKKSVPKSSHALYPD